VALKTLTVVVDRDLGRMKVVDHNCCDEVVLACIRQKVRAGFCETDRQNDAWAVAAADPILGASAISRWFDSPHEPGMDCTRWWAMCNPNAAYAAAKVSSLYSSDMDGLFVRAGFFWKLYRDAELTDLVASGSGPRYITTSYWRHCAAHTAWGYPTRFVQVADTWQDDYHMLGQLYLKLEPANPSADRRPLWAWHGRGRRWLVLFLQHLNDPVSALDPDDPHNPGASNSRRRLQVEAPDDLCPEYVAGPHHAAISPGGVRLCMSGTSNSHPNSEQLTATVEDMCGVELDDSGATYDWSSDDTAVAGISGSGKTITVNAGSTAGCAKISVEVTLSGETVYSAVHVYVNDCDATPPGDDGNPPDLGDSTGSYWGWGHEVWRAGQWRFNEYGWIPEDSADPNPCGVVPAPDCTITAKRIRDSLGGGGGGGGGEPPDPPEDGDPVPEQVEPPDDDEVPGPTTTVWPLEDCNTEHVWYTTTDLTAYAGDVITVGVRPECLKVGAASVQKDPKNALSVTVSTSGHGDCPTCQNCWVFEKCTEGDVFLATTTDPAPHEPGEVAKISGECWRLLGRGRDASAGPVTYTDWYDLCSGCLGHEVAWALRECDTKQIIYARTTAEAFLNYDRWGCVVRLVEYPGKCWEILSRLVSSSPGGGVEEVTVEQAYFPPLPCEHCRHDAAPCECEESGLENSYTASWSGGGDNIPSCGSQENCITVTLSDPPVTVTDSGDCEWTGVIDNIPDDAAIVQVWLDADECVWRVRITGYCVGYYCDKSEGFTNTCWEGQKECGQDPTGSYAVIDAHGSNIIEVVVA